VHTFLKATRTNLSARTACLVVLGLVALNGNSAALARTVAYFTSSASAPTSSMSTVRLQIGTSPSSSGVFNIPSNMLPGDFQIALFDVSNNGTSGVVQEAFTYALTSTSAGGGNKCSLLDSTNTSTCSGDAAPSATSNSGAALLLFRCTSDAAATIPLACGTQNVYITQIYPTAGAGTQQQIANATGLSRGAISGVATASGDYTIGIGGRSFTGGQVVLASSVGMGGPDVISGADGQSRGLLAARTDHLASVVYLPSQAGDTLADQTSILTFTWSATQRLGGTR
jgi:hypothetical protein